MAHYDARRRGLETSEARDSRWMLEALAEARKGVGKTSPNPVVGAVVVRGDRLVGRGWHRRAGAPHAEVEALRSAGGLCRGAELYSTLEPCDHQGRTPPCSRAILDAKISRVVVGSDDPNPLVSGRGVRRLRANGVKVVRGVERVRCDELNAAWFRFITTGRPHVTLKVAMTADGKLASGSGESRWITGPEARREVHALRSQVDALLVGAGTVRADDPRLTARLAAGASPLRVVLDGRLSASPRSRVFGRAAPGALVVTLADAPKGPERLLQRRRVEVLRLPGSGGRVAPPELLAALGRRGIVSLLVEGGSDVFGQLLGAGAWDRLLLFVAPKLLGAEGIGWARLSGGRRMAEALELGEFSARRVGRDALLTVDRPEASIRRRSLL
ncbi:MAG: bifunctional diaminohydroxyphosphoribosylaminopyrimidine deaminase/5-amino-6-(5-phosphoribosylamino)uracil reductase RibD [Deltaproteobacteria bacterium]